MKMQPEVPSKAAREQADHLQNWRRSLTSSLEPLRLLAGTTEREFLQIGARMQAIYQQAFDLSGTAQQLVEVASGERLQSLIYRLREMLSEMDKYLGQAQSQSEASRTTLHSVGDLLKMAGAPLSGVKRMCKHLYILEVSIKIESTHIGEMGAEFINLAIDIKKLSQLIKEKVNIIQELRALLTITINKNSLHIETVKVQQDAKAETTLSNTRQSLGELDEIKGNFSRLGQHISIISAENTNNISTIVQSMQFHDIFRQQVEHVVEAIEGLLPAFQALLSADSPAEDNGRRTLIGMVGDVCELQEAQLQFATSELYSAVVAIVGNLRSIGKKQKQMSKDIFDQTGTLNASGRSFIDDVSNQMTALAVLLGSCADSNTEVAGIMNDITGTVGKITGFVTDIEGIGRDIIQIALNARIKAASTGQEGASLSVLAEEIGQLSNEAVEHTDLITKALAEIDSTTHLLSAEVNSSEENFAARLTGMKDELAGILRVLDDMGDDLLALLSQVKNQVALLASDIENLTGGIDVHERTKGLADAVLVSLKKIFHEARQLHPASAAFKEDLRLMAKRYTMESERRIHESIASRHGVGPAIVQEKTTVTPVSDAEFGDNVDLF
jgi:methyl-accepting chemotaxis protein